MLLWTYPGVVTGSPDRALFTAELDLGLRWRHPTPIRIAGINPYRSGPQARRVAELLPEGTKFLALAECLDRHEQVRAHVILADGTDVASLVRHQRPQLPIATYGGNWDRTWRWPATVIRVVDADSFSARINLGVRTVIDTTIRVAHVNAPENPTAQGQAATVWAERLLQPGVEVDLCSRGLDKWQRPLCSVALPNGSDFGGLLVSAGHAVSYEG